MKSIETEILSFPVAGMSCGSCVAHVQHVLDELAGVHQVGVNLRGGQVNVTYDPNQVDLVAFEEAITGAGYSIPTAETLLQVSGMSCMSCVSHVQGAIGDLPGVLTVTIHLSKGTALVTHVVGMVTTAQLIQAVEQAGYQAAETVQATQEVPMQADQTKGFTWRFKDLIRKG